MNTPYYEALAKNARARTYEHFDSLSESNKQRLLDANVMRSPEQVVAGINRGTNNIVNSVGGEVRHLPVKTPKFPRISRLLGTTPQANPMRAFAEESSARYHRESDTLEFSRPSINIAPEGQVLTRRNAKKYAERSFTDKSPAAEQGRNAFVARHEAHELKQMDRFKNHLYTHHPAPQEDIQKLRDHEPGHELITNRQIRPPWVNPMEDNVAWGSGVQSKADRYVGVRKVNHHNDLAVLGRDVNAMKGFSYVPGVNDMRQMRTQTGESGLLHHLTGKSFDVNSKKMDGKDLKFLEKAQPVNHNMQFDTQSRMKGTWLDRILPQKFKGIAPQVIENQQVGPNRGNWDVTNLINKAAPEKKPNLVNKALSYVKKWKK